MMDALQAPILTHAQSWADTLPKRLLDIIPMARLISLMRGEEMATYPEVVAFIYTRTLEAPMSREWVDIYTHVSCIVCEQYWKEDQWEAVKAPRTLDEYELKQFLNPLRRWIWKRRREVVKQRIKSADNSIKTDIVIKEQKEEQLTFKF